MFKLKNVFNRHPLFLEVTYKDRNVNFDISTLVYKRNKDELNPEKQFILLNSYLDYKGDKFKEELFNNLVDVEEIILNTITEKELYPLPLEMTHKILDMFDMDDVFHYVKNIYKVQPPSYLKETFDMQSEKDALMSRVQTYTRDDYWELAALTIPVKCVIGPIAHFGYIRSSDISGQYKEMVLYNFIKHHPLHQYSAVQKLLGLSEKLVEQTLKDPTVGDVRVIEKQIPKEDTAYNVLSIVMLSKVSVGTIITDDTTSNLITRIYTFNINKLRVKGDAANAISDRRALSDNDSNMSGDEGKESIIESYRMSVIMPKGSEVELDYSASDIDNVLDSVPISINSDVLAHAIQSTKVFLDGDITTPQKRLLGVIFKGLIHPSGIDYITAESIVNLLAVGYSYLWELGYKELAILLTAKQVNTDGDTMVINITVNKNRIPQAVKDRLNDFTPVRRVINKETSSNPVEEFINDISNEFFNRRWLTTVDPKIVKETIGSPNNVLPGDLKTKIALFILEHEELIVKRDDDIRAFIADKIDLKQ